MAHMGHARVCAGCARVVECVRCARRAAAYAGPAVVRRPPDSGCWGCYSVQTLKNKKKGHSDTVTAYHIEIQIDNDIRTHV